MWPYILVTLWSKHPCFVQRVRRGTRLKVLNVMREPEWFVVTDQATSIYIPSLERLRIICRLVKLWEFSF